MSARLVVEPEARIDIAEALSWYEGERSGLGERCVIAVLHLHRRPGAWRSRR